MTAPTVSPDSAAGVIARFLKARGVERVFGLCGGHIMPIWMRIDAKSGLAWVPDLQAIAAWDDAERAWRGEDAQGS